MIAWSYGGGVQSVCIGVLIREGVLPVPDLAGIADTSREKQTTWHYLHEHMQPYLDPIGLKIEVVPHTLARIDLYGKDGRPLVPAYDGNEGRLGSYCSGEWKRDTFERWLRLRGVQECECWIGYSMDELHRAKNDHRSWCRYEFPLIERWITRPMCLVIIEKAGLPLPQKSRCWGCPHQNNEEWQQVRADPEDWQKAIALDEDIRANDPEGKGLFLYSGRVPLALADFQRGIVAPSRPCETGHCWT